MTGWWRSVRERRGLSAPSLARHSTVVAAVAVVTLTGVGFSPASQSSELAPAIRQSTDTVLTRSVAVGTPPASAMGAVPAQDDPWEGISVTPEVREAAEIYRAACLSTPALGDWRTRERVDFKAGVMYAYWQANPEAGPAELTRIGQRFDQDWQKAVTSAAAAGIRDRNEFANLLVDVAGYIPGEATAVKYGQAFLNSVRSVANVFADPTAENALRDQVAADENAAHVDRAGLGRGDGQNLALLWLAAHISPAMMEWAEKGMREVPSVRASTETLIAGSPMLKALQDLGLLQVDVATINGNLKAYSEEIAKQLTGLTELGTTMSGNIKSMLDKQDQLLTYLKDADAKRQVAEMEKTAYQARVDGANAGVQLLSSLVGLADKRTGKALSVVGTATVNIVQAVGRFQDTLAVLDKLELLKPGSQDLSRLLSGVKFTGDIYSMAFGVVTSLLNINAKDPVLESLAALHEEMALFRDSMETRLTQIDGKLNDIQRDTLTEFRAVLNAVGNLSAQVAASHEVLLGIANRLDSLELGMHQRDIDVHRNAVVETVAAATSPTSQGVFTYRDFVTAENTLYFAATDAATHSPLVLEDTATPAAADVESMLARYPAGATVRYLTAQVPKAFGSDALSAATVANPTSWAYAAQAWATLVTAWPAHAAQLPDLTNRAKTIGDVGRRLNDTVTLLSGPAGHDFYNRLLNRYLELVEQLRAQGQTVIRKASTPPPGTAGGAADSLNLINNLPQVGENLLPRNLGRMPLCDGKGDFRMYTEFSFYHPSLALADVLHRWNPDAAGLDDVTLCLEPVWEGEATYTYGRSTSVVSPWGPKVERISVVGMRHLGGVVRAMMGGVSRFSYHLDWQVTGLAQQRFCWNPAARAEDPSECTILVPPSGLLLQSVPFDKLRSAIQFGMLGVQLDEILNHAPGPEYVEAYAAAEVARRRAEAEHAVRAAAAEKEMAGTLAELSSVSAVLSRYGQLSLQRTMAANDVLASVVTGTNGLWSESVHHIFSADTKATALPPGEYPWTVTLNAATERVRGVRAVIDDYFTTSAAWGSKESLPVVDATLARLTLAVASVTNTVEKDRSTALDVVRAKLTAGDAAGAFGSLQAIPPTQSGGAEGVLDETAASIVAGAAEDAAQKLQAQLAETWDQTSDAQRQARMLNTVAADVLARTLGSDTETGAVEWYENH